MSMVCFREYGSYTLFKVLCKSQDIIQSAIHPFGTLQTLKNLFFNLRKED